MTDLHCHILPDIDDGPRNLSETISLIKLQVAEGINRAVATPHYDPERFDLDHFLQARCHAMKMTAEALQTEQVEFQILQGAEVRLHPSLLRLENKGPLCINDSRLMLVELPAEDRWPLWADDVLYQLRLQGVTPILAHIDKYPFLLDKPQKLWKLASGGIYLQVNADSMLHWGRVRRSIVQLFRHEIIHFIGTDAHSTGSRPPHMKQALAFLGKTLGPSFVKTLQENAEAVCAGSLPFTFDPQPFSYR